ncbi:SAICAR synthase-like protein [Metschnikowia bicuspidata]|uniref:Kinase n=1 Tax=Metschnikowia bicuspidata TaxID=27322 RepID=A0A4P9ZB42_9ASCO|nr:SAICAR synthase-like protein [Metschnikowia bicuspidata]
MKFTVSAHQAAGHPGCLEAGPVFAKLTTQQEIDFYAEAQRRVDLSRHLGPNIYDWMPTYMGTLTQGAISNPDAIYIVLQNLLYGYKNPCILDIKLGAVLVDDTVSEEKRQRLAKVSAETTSGSLHFRVCGMKTYNGHSDAKPREVFPGQDATVTVKSIGEERYLLFNKFFGRLLQPTNVTEAIGLFFVDSLNQSLRKALATKFYQRLELLYNCLIDTEVRIKSGSLLFCYDADPPRWQILEEEYNEQDPITDTHLAADSDDEHESGPERTCVSKLKLIDFAHSTFADGQGSDESILVGIENLLKIFEKLSE